MKEIKRDIYLKQLVDRMDNGLIKIVTGIRRYGRSYLQDPIFVNYLKSQGKIITKEDIPLWHDEEGILIMSIYDFLLDEKSLDL